jgi:metal-responsive CopG/Arc/MetJ family transcriptional regulator
VKTAVSIPDDLFERAERHARKEGLSRSELYARALRDWLERQAESTLTASFDEAYRDIDERDAWGDLRDFRRALRARRRSR